MIKRNNNVRMPNLQQILQDLEILLLEAFQNLRSLYFVCKQCFIQTVRKGFNEFRRISLLRQSISHKTVKIHKRLMRFIQIQKIQPKMVYQMNLLEEYLRYIDQNNDSFQLSATFSIESQEEQVAPRQHPLYDRYGWLKEKINENYVYIKGNSRVISDRIEPIQQSVKFQAIKIGQKINDFRREFASFRREVPSFDSIKLSGILKSSKLGNFF